MIPEFHREIGIPRVAAIEYPFGRALGQAHDRAGQRAVLFKLLFVFEKVKHPGEIYHLPFTWPENPKETDWQPKSLSPIVKMFKRDIKRSKP